VSGDWWNWEHGPRRPAKDGIKARSQRGDIGESWWSKRFLAALQAVADTSRLSRGRSYILAEAFDADPFLVLAWRGRPKERLLERLRELRGAIPEPEAVAEPEPVSAAAAPAAAPSSGDFWRAGPELAGLRYAPRAAEVPDAVLRQLGPLPPAAGGEPVTGALAAAYRIFTAAAERRAFGEAGAAGAPDEDAPAN
jgi:uncharacterized Zn finger protein